MDASIYLQINIIPIIALIIMRINTGRTLSYSWRTRALRFMMVLMAANLMVNGLAWMLDGQKFAGARILLWVFNMVYFILFEFMAYLWYLYVVDVLENGVGQRGRSVFVPSIPLLIFVVILCTNPWTKLIFYIDENNYYVRGKGFLIHPIIAMGYVIWASVKALYQSVKEEQIERKTEWRWLAGFVMLPCIGGILQILFYGVELSQPFMAASLLIVYLNVQQSQVIRDGLTGLNNRRRLDQYLLEIDEQNWRGEMCHLLLLDVDRFKKINDTYGHVTGDNVLRLVAEQIKRVFGNSRGFLARYGGDEFVIILKGKTDEEVARHIQELRDGVAQMKWADGCPWKITISVGCARYGEVPMHTVKELVTLADARMYEEKNANRERAVESYY